jgi:ABC-type transport system involved in cytochrome c biogenesis permease subunit
MSLIDLQRGLDNISFAVLLATMVLYWCGLAFRRLTLLPTLGTAGMAVGNLTIAALLIARWAEGGTFL